MEDTTPTPCSNPALVATLSTCFKALREATLLEGSLSDRDMNEAFSAAHEQMQAMEGAAGMGGMNGMMMPPGMEEMMGNMMAGLGNMMGGGGGGGRGGGAPQQAECKQQ